MVISHQICPRNTGSIFGSYGFIVRYLIVTNRKIREQVVIQNVLLSNLQQMFKGSTLCLNTEADSPCIKSATFFTSLGKSKTRVTVSKTRRGNASRISTTLSW